MPYWESKDTGGRKIESRGLDRASDPKPFNPAVKSPFGILSKRLFYGRFISHDHICPVIP